MIGDAPCCVLEDGRLLLGSIRTTCTATLDLSNASPKWVLDGAKGDISSEETWTLLPSGEVITLQCNNIPSAERYVPRLTATNTTNLGLWTAANFSPTALVQASSNEIGPAILLPDGRVFTLGATGHTGFYNRVDQNLQDYWSTGPDFPTDSTGHRFQAKDATACLLPNGRVLCTGSPAAEGEEYPGPTHFFELETLPVGSSTPLTASGEDTLYPVAGPENRYGPCSDGRMLLLPTGQVMYSASMPSIYVYTPDVTMPHDPAWRPVVNPPTAPLSHAKEFTLTGTGFNGLSQAVSYGDDAAMATNYPIVCVTDGTRKIWYCRTRNHNSMGVARSAATSSTTVLIPDAVPLGKIKLFVVANGISSLPVDVTLA
jgi:hypothetical protein